MVFMAWKWIVPYGLIAACELVDMFNFRLFLAWKWIVPYGLTAACELFDMFCFYVVAESNKWERFGEAGSSWKLAAL